MDKGTPHSTPARAHKALRRDKTVYQAQFPLNTA